MKSSNILLISGIVATLVYRDEIKKFFEKQADGIRNSLQDYAGQKVGVKPYKFPKIDFDAIRQKIKLSGSVLFDNKTPVETVLEAYKIEVVLEKDGKIMLLGKTPLLQPNAVLKANSKSKVNYRFDLSLNDLSKILNDNKDLVDYQMFVLVTNLNVSGFSLPNQKIKIAEKWQKIVQIIRNPTDFLNLLNI